jgi:hypothetical protein
MKAYKEKGRLSDLVNSIPLFAVLVEDIGLRGGAGVCAMRVSSNRLFLLPLLCCVCLVIHFNIDLILISSAEIPP